MTILIYQTPGNYDTMDVLHDFGNKCHVRGCKETLFPDTMACTDHQGLWKKYKLDHLARSLAGSKRMLNCHKKNLE